MAREPRVEHANGLATKKADAGDDDGAPSPRLLGTLVQTHTNERVLLDDSSPSELRFDALLADRATGSSIPLDSRLVGLLRAMAAKYGAPETTKQTEGAEPIALAPAVELVSGFRSPKLNEMLRKKGHHVASHSQHSLGHAVDFRIVRPCTGPLARNPACGGGASAWALDPRVAARAIRATGWDGGTGIYTLSDDWFVHADVGPNRTWYEGPRGARRRPECPDSRRARAACRFRERGAWPGGRRSVRGTP